MYMIRQGWESGTQSVINKRRKDGILRNEIEEMGAMGLY